jgi:hypothetical protein
MPATYGQMARRYGLGNDPFNPHDNVLAAAAYLRWLHNRYGYPAMFAAYNDGPGMWEAHTHQGRALPAETRNYLRSIVSVLGGVPNASAAKVEFTRPNGSKVAIYAVTVVEVRAPVRGEYPSSVHAVVRVGRVQQGVRERVAIAIQRLRRHGAVI